MGFKTFKLQKDLKSSNITLHDEQIKM